MIKGFEKLFPLKLQSFGFAAWLSGFLGLAIILERMALLLKSWKKSLDDSRWTISFENNGYTLGTIEFTVKWGNVERHSKIRFGFFKPNNIKFLDFLTWILFL